MMQIKTIDLLSNVTCNLKCKFCYLHKNKAFTIFNEEVKQAWLNGTYPETAKAVLLKLKQDPKNIQAIEFWGGESLLHPELLTPNISKIFKTFPKVSSFFISTNWMISVEKLFEFLQEIDKNCTSEFKVNLQLSIDGPPGISMEEGHPGNWDKYRDNIELFCNKVNNFYFKYIKIYLNINATLGKKAFFTLLSTEEGMYSYIKYMKDFASFIKERCISKHLDFNSDIIFPGYATPYSDTTADGIKLGNIFRLWDYVWAKYFKTEVSRNRQLYSGINHFCKELSVNSRSALCGQLRDAVTIAPDGTVSACFFTAIYNKDYYLQELQEEGNEAFLKQAKIFKKTIFNPLTSENIDDDIWYIMTGAKDAYRLDWLYMYALADELAYCGQIPTKFHKNHDKLINHVSAISPGNSCLKENVYLTNTHILPSPSFFRRYLNGASDYAIEFNEEEGKVISQIDQTSF